MKTRINRFILLILASFALFAEAKEIKQTKACQLATRFASGLTADSAKLRSNALLQLAYTATGNNLMRADAARPLFYIYNVEGNGGFVIVSADDAVPPILGYAGQGEFTAQSMPSNLRKWLGHYEKEISFAINQGYTASEKIRQEWDALANGTLNAGNPVVLMKTANWDQNSPYNNLCPMDGRSRSMAGCVATAMGTIMKYHQWPVKGTGSISYATRSKGILVNADFNVVYDWGNMLDTYVRNNWTPAQNTAVATLVFHSGAAALMNYKSDESGAWGSDAVEAFINNFGYDKGTYLVCRDFYTTGEWDALLQNELKANRPLLYGGATKDVEGESRAGHQFIIDGYAPGENTACYYHVNWGWNGAINGYFLLDALDPQGGGKPGEGFSYEQDVALGLQKAQEGSFTNNEMFFLESNDYEVAGLQVDTGFIVAGQPFLMATSYIYDYGERNFEGEWGFFLVDKQGNRKAELDVSRYPLPKKTALYNTPEEYTVTGNVEEGDRIRMYYRPDGHDWKPVRGMPGAVLEIPVSAKASSTSNVAVAPQESSVIASFQPESGNIHIRSPKNEAIRETWLYNLSGQLIRHNTFTSANSQATIPATQLSPGAYILEVRTAKGRYGRKVIRN